MTIVYTKYHGEKWAMLVEFGYVTVSVDDNDIALMVKENKRSYPKLGESYGKNEVNQSTNASH